MRLGDRLAAKNDSHYHGSPVLCAFPHIENDSHYQGGRVCEKPL